MSRVAKSGVGTRAVREFGLALRSGPFRVALVLSLIVHLALFIVFGRGGPGREGGGDRRSPLVQVRLLPPPPPVAVPAAPAIKPAVQQPRREQSGRPAAEDPLPPSDSTLPAPEVRVPTVAQEPAPLISPVAVQTSLTPAVGVQGTGAVAPVPIPATAGSGSGGSRAAGLEREGSEAVGAVAAAAGVHGPAAAAATAARSGPGPRDLAAVWRRIDARKVYPRIAVRNGWEGRVLVEMQLEGDGRLVAVRLLEGSGYAVLDAATLTAVRRASPFPPVARVLTVPVEYRLVP